MRVRASFSRERSGRTGS